MVTLLYFMYILVVTWWVTVPVCFWGGILHILPKLATMSALCSWHVHCLGWVIWWSDRNRQNLLTESVNECILCVLKYMCLHVNKVNNALQTCMSLWYFRWGSCLSWAGVVLDIFWWHPFQHDLGLGGQGGQHLGFLGWRTCVHLGNWIQLHWEVDQNSWGRGQ